MQWTTNDIDNLILVGKDVGVHIAQSICNKMDLGKYIDKDIEYLYLISNIVFALEHSTTDVYEDTDYSYLAEIINRVEIQRNRFRSI